MHSLNIYAEIMNMVYSHMFCLHLLAYLGLSSMFLFTFYLQVKHISMILLAHLVLHIQRIF